MIFFNVLILMQKEEFIILDLLIQCTCSPWYMANAGRRPLISPQGTSLAVTANSFTHLYIGLSAPDETALLLLL